MFRKILLTTTLMLVSKLSSANIDRWTGAVHDHYRVGDARQIVSETIRQSRRKGLRPLFVLSLMAVESSFKTHASNGYGARGLMQVVPRYHRDKLHGRSPYHIATNIDVGTTILDDCFRKHRQRRKAISCYSGYTGRGLDRYMNSLSAVQTILNKHHRRG